MKSTLPLIVVALILSVFGSQAFCEKLTLEQVIREVSLNSDSVKSMKQTVEKAHQMVREQWANALPKVSGSLMAGRTYARGMSSDDSWMNSLMSNPGDTATKGDIAGALGGAFGSLGKSGESALYSSSINVVQTIYTFGKIGTALEIAKQYEGSALVMYNRNLQQLEMSSLDMFYRFTLASLAFDVEERSLARKKELYDFLSRNFSMGSGVKAQMLMAKADMKGSEASSITARQNVTASKMMLNSMMGRQLSNNVEVDTSSSLLSLVQFKLPSQQEAVETALAERQDLQVFRYLQRANEGGVKIFKANYLPNIAGVASIGTSGDKPENLIDADYRTWTIGVNLSWMFFDGFANSAKAMQYKTDAKKMEITYQTVAKMIEIEVLTALSECSAADSSLGSSQEMLAASQESYDLIDQNFKQGSGTYTDVQQSEERLRQAELGFYNARYRQVRSRAALLLAMGKDIISVEGK